MERLKSASEALGRALRTLEEILSEPPSVIVRDAAIQRFEYSFEIFWKSIKEYIRVNEGIICNSPKSCFRQAFATNILSNGEVTLALEMADERNMTAHTYHEEVAEEIFEKIPEYCRLMKKVSGLIRPQ